MKQSSFIDQSLSRKSVLDSNTFKELCEKVYQRRPQLKYILERHGEMPLTEFAKSYNETYGLHIMSERKNQFIDTFTSEVERLLGRDAADSCAKQLRVTYRVTTTDHHGPLSEPGMVNCNINEALPYLEGDAVIKNIMVLGCANISFDNESFPRGLLFNSRVDETISLNQLVFYPRSVRPRPVINFPAYTEEITLNTQKLIAQWQRDKVVSPQISKDVVGIVQDIYLDEKVLASEYFSEQVTKTNYMLWNRIMRQYPKAPKLIYIEQESLVNSLLLKYHLNEDTFINKLLFTPKCHELLVKYFDQIDKGFSIKEKRGTYLFWALPHGAKYRVQLWKQGDFLQTEDGSFKVSISPEGIKQAILSRELIPSTLLSFMLLSFYYGVKLTGGTNQTTYLKQMKNAFVRMQRELGDIESIDFAQNVPTDVLSVAVESLIFLHGPHGMLPATGIDLLLYGTDETLPSVRRLAQGLTLTEAFYRAFPDCYKWYYKESERDDKLDSISKQDVEEYLNIGHKLIPSATI